MPAVVALVVADALVARPGALLLGVALAVSVAVVWYAQYASSPGDSGPLDGVGLALIALAVSGAALGVGALLGRVLR